MAAEAGVVYLVVDRLWHPQLQHDLASAPSHDFH
jgi:hypothetical protein